MIINSSVDPQLSEAVTEVDHHVGWINALCKAADVHSQSKQTAVVGCPPR